MSQEFDLIVIGTGPSGSTIARKCSEQGWNVAAIEATGFGGICPISGCIPKKVLSSTAELIEKVKRMEGSGIQSDSQINWKGLIRFKRTFTEPVSRKKQESLEDKGISTFYGQASFVSQNEIKVGSDILKGEKIVIATGATPAPLPIDGVEHLTYSDEFLELDHLPQSIIFVGGGYISFEFAHIAARAGSDVHIIEGGDKALTGFDPTLVDLLVQKSKDIGIQIDLNTAVQAIEKTEDGYKVLAEKDDQQLSWQSDLVIHGAGRVPNIQQLAVKKGNIASEKSGITVNEYLQSISNPNVYAAGDVADTDGPPLTPVAGIEAKVVSENLLNGNKRQLTYTGIPSIAFTSPKIATVGMSEEEAKESSKKLKVAYSDTSDWFTNKHTNQNYGATKIITDENSGEILAAHLLSEEADALINVFAMAVQLKLTVDDLKKVTYAFPTAISDLPSML